MPYIKNNQRNILGGFIDGGRAYDRIVSEPELFTARVKDGIMDVVDNDGETG